MAEKSEPAFTKEEREAMKERAREAKLEARRAKGENLKAQDLADVLAKFEKMVPADRQIGERIHALVGLHAPQLAAKTWYGMPAWALDGKTVCFFQSGVAYKTRYCTFGFTDTATLDDGQMWATGFAITALTQQVEDQIVQLLKRATSA